jgi:hypothetical protein
MMRTLLYLDPWSGISGDMLLAALLDAGQADLAVGAALDAAVASLGLEGVRVEVTREVEGGIVCTRVRVRGEESPPLRHLGEMTRIIERAELSARVREQATGAVAYLAEVEAALHGCPVDEIHFHEVGAVDTLVDVVGTFVLLEVLGVEEVRVGDIPVGGGTVEIAHGRVGVPAPATAALLEGYRIVGGLESRELTTPTGALLINRLGAIQGPLPPMTLERVGHGAGTMRLEGGPNILRALLGRACAPAGADALSSAGEQPDTVVELVTNLDDVSGEVVGYAVRSLREGGALDVWTLPAHMKKDRPGVILHVLVRPENEAEATDTLFRETGTLGVRRREWTRRVAARGTTTVTVDGEKVRVKWGRWCGRLVALAPEYDDVSAVARSLGRPWREVMRLAEEAARAQAGAEEHPPAEGPGGR